MGALKSYNYSFSKGGPILLGDLDWDSKSASVYGPRGLKFREIQINCDTG